MKKQSIGIILAAALGVGSLFGAAIPGADTLFNTSSQKQALEIRKSFTIGLS